MKYRVGSYPLTSPFVVSVYVRMCVHVMCVIFIVDVRFTSANLTLLVLGVILFCVAIAGCVILVVVEVKSDKGIIRTYCASMNYNKQSC